MQLQNTFTFVIITKLQVNKIVQLLSSYTLSQKIEAFNYFFTNINFVFPLCSQTNNLIEPNLKISLILLSANKNTDEISMATPCECEIEEEKTNAVVSINPINGKFDTTKLTPRKLVINLKRLKMPIKNMISTINNEISQNIKFLIGPTEFHNQYLPPFEDQKTPDKILSIESVPCSVNQEIDQDSVLNGKIPVIENNCDFQDSKVSNFNPINNIKIDEKLNLKSKSIDLKVTTEISENEKGLFIKKFKCLLCEKIYRKKKSLMCHSQHHHPGQCPLCGLYYGLTASEKGEHNKMHHFKEHPFICEECGESFKRNQQFQRHLETHKKKISIPKENQKNVKKCDICSTEFKSNKCFEKHILDGHKTEGYMCDRCGSHFKDKYSLQQHNFKVHKKELHCPQCSKKFTYKSNLDRHILLHTEHKKSYICEKCGSAYFTPMALKEHFIYAHKFSKDFGCHICKKSFAAKRSLQRHQIVHSDERPYNCSLCSRSFKIKSNLVRHKHLTHNAPIQIEKEKKLPKNLIAKTNNKIFSAKEKNNKSNITPTNVEENNLFKVLNNEIQYQHQQEFKTSNNIEMHTQQSHIFPYYNNDFEANPNASENINLHRNHTQNNYTAQTDWNNTPVQHEMNEYSLINAENLIALQIKSESKQRDNCQIMDIPNVDLIHYQDLWNTNDQSHEEYNTEIDGTNESHTYNNIGSILTNLEMMENQINHNDTNIGLTQFQTAVEINQIKTQNVDQASYDFNSHNHTIIDISNTFLRENLCENPDDVTPNNETKREPNNITDVMESIDLSQKQFKEILQNTNENVTLPSLIDYLQHPYQF